MSGMNQELGGRVRYLVTRMRGLANLNLRAWIEIILSPGGDLGPYLPELYVCYVCMFSQAYIINGKY